MLKLANKYSDNYPNYEFKDLKFVVRDFTMKFYSDCKRLEREFNRYILKENFNAQKDIIELTDAFQKVFADLPVEEYDQAKDNPEVMASVKDKIIENLVNNKEEAESIMLALFQQEIDLESCKELFILDNSVSVAHGGIIQNVELILKTFLQTDDFSKIQTDFTDDEWFKKNELDKADYLFDLSEFCKIVLNDFFLYMQKSRKKSTRIF